MIKTGQLKRFGFVLILLLTSSLASLGQAFSELTRHGYFQCSTCHYSPAGGGILTDYGRALSKEVLSQGSWFFESSHAANTNASAGAPGAESDLDPEVLFAQGLVATPQWLKLGGDIRALQAFRDNQRETSGRFLLMQADLEALLSPEISGSQRLRLDFTLGRDEPRVAKPQLKDYVISRRHWLSVLLGPNDQPDLLQLRVGRFFPAYGIQFAEHTWVTRKKMGFDQGQETYNVEAGLGREDWGVVLTAILGRPDVSAHGGRGASLQIARSLGNARVGWNGIWTSESQMDQVRRGFGFFGMTPLFADFYALGEWNWVSRTQSAGRTSDAGWIDALKLGWEATQGFHLFLTQELAHPTFFRESAAGLSLGKTEAYGLGMQYFPRPHWDLSVHLRKERVSVASQSFDSVAWLLLHYYL